MKLGFNDARIALGSSAIRSKQFEKTLCDHLGHHVYNVEKNYTKAAKYWQDCYDQNQNMYCAHNLVR